MSELLEELSHEELRKYTKKELSKRLSVLEVKHDIKQTKDELIDLLRAEGGQFDNLDDEYVGKKYVVLHDFKDLEDKGYVYIKGDPYPRKGNKKVTQERVNELLSTENKMGKPLIKEQE